jgi:hypothetical protein
MRKSFLTRCPVAAATPRERKKTVLPDELLAIESGPLSGNFEAGIAVRSVA